MVFEHNQPRFYRRSFSSVMALVTLFLLTIASFVGVPVHASPIDINLTQRAVTSVNAMTASQESSYTPVAMFASAAYCPASQTATWSCGANCDVLPGFVPYGSGGDGVITQYWFVGYDPTYFKAIVVGHQGTAPSKVLPLLEDSDLFLKSLDQTLFPGVPTNLEAHNGFLDAHSRSASGVLAAVKKAQAATGSNHVVITGHSLGGAIALLDSLYLPLHLPADTTFETTVFGLPRVGDPAFATYVDQHVTNFAHITNKLDIIPILPFRFLGFAHPSNEKHIVTSGLDAGNWYACEGQDNANKFCSTGAVRSVFEGVVDDHYGPYGTVYMGGCHGIDSVS